MVLSEYAYQTRWTKERDLEFHKWENDGECFQKNMKLLKSELAGQSGGYLGDLKLMRRGPRW